MHQHQHSCAALAMLCLLLGVGPRDAAAADPKYAFNVPGGLLADTLVVIGRQTSINIVFAPETIDDSKAPEIRGVLTVEEAITRALSNSNLRARQVTGNSIVIESLVGTSPGEPRFVRITDLVRDPPGTQLSKADGTPDSAATLQEVIVTSQKRPERLQDVAAPVTVLDPVRLAENSLDRIQDYYAQVPGLNFFGGGYNGGTQMLAIRGISTGAFVGNPTVGMVIDDVPFGSSQALGFGAVLNPDIDPSDLARIEVLKGPQGTLYGADSLGGLIKIVTQDPNTTAVSGQAQALGDYVDHGAFGYAIRAAVNLPLSDVLAIRASGFSRRDAGFIHNVTTDEHAVNQADTYGGRIAALWRPSDVLSVKLSALLQDGNGDGSAWVNSNALLQPTLGDLRQSGLSIQGQYKTQIRLYTATLTAKLGSLDLTSVSGFGVNELFNNTDYSQGFFGAAAQQYFPPASGATGPEWFETKKFSQELRLSSPSGQRLEWLTGLFYTHESTIPNQYTLAVKPPSVEPVGQLINWYFPSTLDEYALFADLTAHFTDRFDIQLGGRSAAYRQTFNETDTGPLVPSFDGVSSSPYVQPAEYANGNSFTYLATPRFKLSPDIMLYARIASGYRIGGPNEEAELLKLPATYKPDTTVDYEVGIKADLLGHSLTVDMSAYYINWKDIQIELVNPQTYGVYFVNGGGAKSQGLEFALTAHPTTALKVSVVGAFNDAELTETLPANAAAYGLSGASLPFSSRFSGSLSADQNIGHIGTATGIAGASVSYVGAREGPFQPSSTIPRFQFPGYATLNLHTGVKSGPWAMNLFANNVTDRRGLIGGSTTSAIGSSGYYAVVIQPLTIGLSVVRHF
jgi:iron complex outermembrane receptor protein